MTDASSLHALQLAFAQHLRDPGGSPLPAGIPERRAAVYRELFLANVRGALESAFPVAHEVVPGDLWSGLIDGFWREHRSHAPEFPRLPAEFLQWFAARPMPFTEEPDYLYELLLWEHVELAALLAPDDPAAEQGDLMAGCPIASYSLQVHAFRYPVQRISANYLPEAPAGEPVFLACFRNRSLGVDFMTLTPAAAWLLEHLLEQPQRSGNEHARALAEALQWDVDGLTAEVSQMFDDFFARGVVIGSRASSTDWSTP